MNSTSTSWPAFAQVVEAFGTEVLAADGHLDRRRLRERIFTDPGARRRLEAILHPAIRAEMERQSREAGGAYQVLVIPLLTEGKRRDHVDRVLLVDVPEALQVERLMMRDGVSREQAVASLNAQATRAARLAMADDVLRNSGQPDELRDRVAELRSELVSIERESSTRRKRREQQNTVALVGYTNAGKSSWMRVLTGSGVLVQDKLFATLDTTVRALQPETVPRILVSRGEIEETVRRMALEGMKLRMREIKDLQSIAVGHRVQKVGATFAAVVLWEKETSGEMDLLLAGACFHCPA